MTRRQRTISKAVSCTGKGVHSGIPVTARFLPAPENNGYTFVRTDLPGKPSIPGSLDAIVEHELARRTTLARGDAKVHTIEHMLSAAFALGIDNMTIEMDGPEAPFLDGSALPFANLLTSAGIAEQDTESTPIAITRPMAFTSGSAEISVVPDEQFRVSFFYTSDEPLLRNQSASYVIEPDAYLREIAPARTFCFFHEIEALRRAGLIRGGNLSSAVVIGRKAVVNSSLRFADEPVRHKILDFIGDVALLGRPLAGHFLAWRSGHQVHAAFGKFLKKELGL
ncbi:MAG: UDP-3-O-acyl-N-acetylglucosamine deacetylase [Candidatus Sumerlaeaceae bacterium]|nr:UDP-3-O-acyl-N-acetylglucosamine deacetylase [Candidatus Sumerlaeaceae bacterium]